MHNEVSNQFQHSCESLTYLRDEEDLESFLTLCCVVTPLRSAAREIDINESGTCYRSTCWLQKQFPEHLKHPILHFIGKQDFQQLDSIIPGGLVGEENHFQQVKKILRFLRKRSIMSIPIVWSPGCEGPIVKRLISVLICLPCCPKRQGYLGF